MLDMIPEFTLPAEWDHCSGLINDEEFSAASTEVSMIYEQFQTDEERTMVVRHDSMDPTLMEVDEQLGSSLLGDDIFHDPCFPPSGPLEDFESISFVPDDRFSLSLLEEEDDNNDSAPSTSQPSPQENVQFEQRYKLMLDRLAESMRRSQESRKSLTIDTAKTKDYERRKSLSGVLSSVEKSTNAIQELLNARIVK